MLRLAVDVGGTFTDIVAYHAATGRMTFGKVPSVPSDPGQGVLDAVSFMAAQSGLSTPDLLARTELLVHGTTVATNTLAEGTGPRLGLITTRGFRDVLELREGTKAERYALRTPFPDALVPREHRIEVTERLRWDGAVVTPLDEAELRDALARLQADGVEAIVVGFLHAHANPVHEQQAAASIRAAGWAGPLVASHEVVRCRGEYPRISSAAVNAIVTPRLAAYLGDLESRLEAAGRRVPVMVVQSSGGFLPAQDAVGFGIGCVASGPAGGAAAAALLARLVGRSDAVGFDVGGTTTDISVIADGVPVERARSDTDAYAIAVPAIDIRVHAIGGGSIAAVDAGGRLQVGPRSSGAIPGPACFGRGGTRATVTDAALVLGLLSEDAPLGGRLRLSRGLAEAAVRRDVAEPLDLSVEDAARAIHALAASRIAEGVRAATVGGGRDPRDMALLAFGGAGGLYIDHVATELEVGLAVAPRAASVLSALGFLGAEPRVDALRSLARPVDGFASGELAAIVAEQEVLLAARLARAGYGSDRIRFVRHLDCRYIRQTGTVPVPIHDMADAAGIAEVFAARYETLFGHRHAGETCIVETCRIAAYGVDTPFAWPELPPAPPARVRATRRVFDGVWREVPVFALEDLAAGQRIAGPAILDSSTTTIVLGAGREALLDDRGSLRLAPLHAAQDAA